jgi:hypothetical protein
MRNLQELFEALGRSEFRSRFRLGTKEAEYLKQKGLETIAQHADKFLRQRLAPAQPPNDGKQTPMRGHPVFIAQHATATCCRNCLRKWHRIPTGTPMTEEQIAYAVLVIRHWLDRTPDGGSGRTP